MADRNNFCQGSDANFTAIPLNGGTNPVFQWKVNGTNAGANQNTFNYIPANGDLVTCTLISNENCTSGNPAVSIPIKMKVIPSHPVSIVIFADQDSICEGTAVNFTSTATNGGTSPVYQWKVNGVQAGNNSSLFSYIPLNNDVVNCVITSNNAVCATGSPATSNSISIAVEPLVQIGISINESSNNVCQGTSVMFTATATNAGFSPTFQWTVNGINSGTNSDFFTYIPSNGDKVNCSVASGAMCVLGSPALSNSVFITVNPILPVSIAIDEDKNFVCQGDTVIITSTSQNPGDSPVYEWFVNGLQVGFNTPEYTFIPYNNDQVSCTLTSNALCAVSNPASGNRFLACTQIFGMFSTVPGQYSVQGENPVGNCIAMMRDTINVIMNPTPVTDFTTNNACATDTTYFTLTGNFLPRTSSWHWTFGDGTFATYNAPFSPSHVYPTYGIYTVTLSVEDTNGCQYTVTHPVEVMPHPTAFFSINTPNCLGDITQFTDLSNNPQGQGYIQQWIWDFGDGSPKDTIDFPDSPNVTHPYVNQGNYNVTLNVINSKGCAAEYSLVVSVTNRPIAGFTSWSSCEDKVATFVDNSDENLGGQITSWNWNFGEPTSGTQNFSTLENPVHTYSTPGNFVVTLIITNLNGCSDTIQNTINVKSKPLSNFFSSPGCVNSATQFLADSTVINTGATAIYQWNFGDGATSFSRNVLHTYVAPGTYNVTLTVTDTAGCVGDTILPVTVNPPPTALFSANTDNCQGQSVAFANQSVSTSGFITTWEWNFGDGNTQTVTFPNPPNVNHTYAGTGTFAVTLTVTNNEGCSHSETRTVNSLGAPSADFMSNGQCAGTAVNFTDLTSVSGNQTLDRWNWNFGDPTSGVSNTSILQNPTHVFAAAGTYTVKLITFTGNNCSDTIQKR
jgi:PKD repeat protein